MMNRRNFLRSLVLGSATILVGKDVWNWKRKYFPGVDFSIAAQDLKDIYAPMGRSVFPSTDIFSTLLNQMSDGQFGGRGLYFNIDMK